MTNNGHHLQLYAGACVVLTMSPRGQHRLVQPWEEGTHRCQVCGYVDCRSKDSSLFATWECHYLHEGDP